VKIVMHVNGIPKANMSIKTRTIISVFDLNSVLRQSGTVSTIITAKPVGKTSNKARYAERALMPNMFPKAALCLSRKVLT